MSTRLPLLPYQALPPRDALPRPYLPDMTGNDGDWKGATGSSSSSSLGETAFVSTLREEIVPTPPNYAPETPNFFEILLANECLPSDKFCSQCLRDKKKGNCETCLDVCRCYCNALCKTEVKTKRVSKVVTVNPPPYRRDPSRLIPRIVHQVSSSMSGVGRE